MKKKLLRAVATDGHRLSRLIWIYQNIANNLEGVIIPRKTIGEIKKLLIIKMVM